jgi:hypothetical protein
LFKFPAVFDYPPLSRVARALPVSILESKKRALAVKRRLVAGVFDGSGGVHRPLIFRLADGHCNAAAMAIRTPGLQSKPGVWHTPKS